MALYLRNLNTACKHLRAVRLSHPASPRRWPLWACSAASSTYYRRDTERAQTRPVGCRWAAGSAELHGRGRDRRGAAAVMGR